MPLGRCYVACAGDVCVCVCLGEGPASSVNMQELLDEDGTLLGFLQQVGSHVDAQELYAINLRQRTCQNANRPKENLNMLVCFCPLFFFSGLVRTTSVTWTS